jgi:hypothetical protein
MEEPEAPGSPSPLSSAGAALSAARPLLPFGDGGAPSWPQDAAGPVPQGLDASSYLAGERAAYARAFSFALPSQQALGQLFAAVDQLHGRLEGDARAVREVQLLQAREGVALEAAVLRLGALEQGALPELQRKWESLATRPAVSPEVTDALRALRDVLGSLTQAQRQYLDAAAGYRGPARALAQQLRWLLVAAAAYGAAALSGADVAALLLSRRVLVGDWDVARGAGLRRPRVQAAVTGALFVGAVEAAWQLQERLAARAPAPLRRLGGPLRVGLRAARAAVWTAAFVVTAAQVREACAAAAERLAGPRQAGLPVTAAAGATAPPGTPGAAAGSPAPPAELMRANGVYDEAGAGAGSD